MNISFSARHESFRDEVRRFLDTALTDELRDADFELKLVAAGER